jgi:hypothetical protein
MRSSLVLEKIRQPAWALDDDVSRDYCAGEFASQIKTRNHSGNYVARKICKIMSLIRTIALAGDQAWEAS